MIEPQTISENMMYSTIRIETEDNETGTGFFFGFSFDKIDKVILVTNKHVIRNERKTIKFYLHIKNELELENESIEFEAKWYFHPTSDLCFCFVTSLFNHLENKENTKMFYRVIKETDIWDNEKLKELSAVEDIIMVGYPDGLWDEKNNFPLFRKGITSSHPGINFNGSNIGLIDIACFKGSSGSPIFILNESGYRDKKGLHLGDSRLIFLGVFCNGYNSRDPESFNKDLLKGPPLHLGEYIKASEILYFKSIIHEQIK